jgi:hypothetical protein
LVSNFEIISTEVYSLSSYAYFTIFLSSIDLWFNHTVLAFCCPKSSWIYRICNDPQHTSANTPAQCNTSSLLLVRQLQAAITHSVALFAFCFAWHTLFREFSFASAAQTYRFKIPIILFLSFLSSTMSARQHISFAF